MNNPVNRNEYDGHSGAVIDRPDAKPLVSPLSNIGSKRAFTKAKGRRGKAAKTRILGLGIRGRDSESPTRAKTGVAQKITARSHLKVADRFYWFRKPTRINLIFSASNFVAGIGRGDNFFITGRGRSEGKAIKSLSENVDREIQRLYRCLPMQLSDKEQATLRALESLFDLDRFRSSIHTETIESALFSRLNNLLRFDCFGGPRIEIHSHKCSGLFDSLKDGDWCEIAVRKRLQDSTVESVQLRRLVDEPQSLSDDEFQRELSELPKADFPPLPDGPVRSN